MGLINRRDFAKTGSLAFALANGGVTLSFVPDGFYDSGEQRNSIPFRKPPREIREVVPGFLWADAADFGEYGGWALDTQHVGFMGSSYLIAHGAGVPVKDAVLRVKNARPGKYRLWVRNRNWLPEHSPGRFGILVNGTDSGTEYGAQKSKGWIWQDGGIHDLPGGEVQLALQDRTGYFGRCSSVLLAADAGYTPPAEVKAFQSERARLSGESDQIQRKSPYEVVVVGAGTAGCCAAIAAARMGARTALVSDRPVLGGNASVEIGVPVQGAAHRYPFARETGIIEEAGRLGYAKGWGKTMTRAFAELASREANLDTYDNFFVEGVEKEGGRIRAAIGRNTLTGERTAFPAAMFIDASGDGWLGYHAGADFRLGREARSEANEPDAPEKADQITMSGCLRGPEEGYRNCLFYRTAKSPSAQPFAPPPWLYDLPEDWINRRGDADKLEGVATHGTWWLEHPGDVDDLWDPEFARDELIRVNYTFWNYMKNRWAGRDRLAKYRLEYLPFMVGKRETRRLMGDYILNQNDCLSARPFEDAIGHAGWTLDIHAPLGIFSTTGPFDNITRHIIPVCQIPYRSLYSRNVENLLMAGRAMSVTHVALGTVRVQGQTALTGQAAGTAAALALRRGTTPRGIYQNHIKELQQLLLKNDQYIPGVPNQDPADLARQAEVRASSELAEADNPFLKEVEAEEEGPWLTLDRRLGVCFPWEAGRRLDRIRVFLEAAEETPVTLHLRGASAAGDLSAETDLATVAAVVRSGSKGWVDFAIDAEIATPYAWIHFDRAKAVAWRRSAMKEPGISRLFEVNKKEWQAVEGSGMSFVLDPDPKYSTQTSYPAANVVNGVARPVKDRPNLWSSAKGETLPQWIELKLKAPSKVGMVQCVFDTDLSIPLAKQKMGVPEACIRDYTLECAVDGAWLAVATVRGNCQRFRRHAFGPLTTDRIRLTVEATHGAECARVMEMRVYADNRPVQ